MDSGPLDRYRLILEQIRDGNLQVPSDVRAAGVFELRLKALRALGYVQGTRGRDIHLTKDGQAFLKSGKHP